MFTGIVEGVGKVEKIEKSTKNRSAIKMRVNLGRHGTGLKIGQSVALNGVCLTVTNISKNKCFKMVNGSLLRMLGEQLFIRTAIPK